ncbi:hypothetical protein [Paenibacillus chitinolyticus]|uniref:hypothetical protein n=1 Tax=Paenibacillus chitinolyticus TaxID=79263 RepID=UPI001C4712C1|nr:hypothetical protein [Paenibacillus chitinolyticus]MBV6717228.1 hypothetical protein [Paenibacillus chitinolyticus]
MAVYEKPACHCGSELVLSEEFFYREQRRIGHDGVPAQRRMKQTDDDKYSLTQCLRCPICTHHFAFDYDEQGRIVLIGDIVGGRLNNGQNGSVVSK